MKRLVYFRERALNSGFFFSSWYESSVGRGGGGRGGGPAKDGGIRGLVLEAVRGLAAGGGGELRDEEAAVGLRTVAGAVRCSTNGDGALPSLLIGAVGSWSER